MSRSKRVRRRTPAPDPVTTPASSAPTTPDDDTPATAAEASTEASGGSIGVSTPPSSGRRSLGQLGPVLVLRAAHPRQALLTAAAVAGVAAVSGRAPREVGVVFATVLVGQSMIGWHNDLVDRRRDRADERSGKPLADGRLEAGTVWFVLACAALLVVPLSITSGVTAGLSYLAALVVGLLGNVLFRSSWLSWLTWAVSFALYPAYLSYGGWGGKYLGDPPEISVTVLAAALGVCVHFVRALPGLVADNRDGIRHLPLRVALKVGAPRLLYLSVAATALVTAGLVLAGLRIGLTQ
jgi:4-hydroxybenzoate polyprenyltransferase